MKKSQITQLKFERELQSAQYNLLGILRPTIAKVEGKYLVCYGEEKNNSIVGVGDTPHEAVLDFNKQWHNNIEKNNQKNILEILTTI